MRRGSTMCVWDERGVRCPAGVSVGIINATAAALGLGIRVRTHKPKSPGPAQPRTHTRTTTRPLPAQPHASIGVRHGSGPVVRAIDLDEDLGPSSSSGPAPHRSHRRAGTRQEGGEASDGRASRVVSPPPRRHVGLGFWWRRSHLSVTLPTCQSTDASSISAALGCLELIERRRRLLPASLSLKQDCKSENTRSSTQASDEGERTAARPARHALGT